MKTNGSCNDSHNQQCLHNLRYRFASRLKLALVILENIIFFAKCIGPSPNLPLADCMSFSYRFKTLRSRNSYDSRTQSEISAHRVGNTQEAETVIFEGSEENSMRFSLELVDERIKASLELLDAQISALTEMMDRLIQSNSTKETTAASSRGIPHQYESPYSEVLGSSRFPTVAPLTTARYSPDTHLIFAAQDNHCLVVSA